MVSCRTRMRAQLALEPHSLVCPAVAMTMPRIRGVRQWNLLGQRMPPPIPAGFLGEFLLAFAEMWINLLQGPQGHHYHLRNPMEGDSALSSLRCFARNRGAGDAGSQAAGRMTWANKPIELEKRSGLWVWQRSNDHAGILYWFLSRGARRSRPLCHTSHPSPLGHPLARLSRCCTIDASVNSTSTGPVSSRGWDFSCLALSGWLCQDTANLLMLGPLVWEIVMASPGAR